MARKPRREPDHFTLLVVPHTKQAPISFRMPHWALYGGLLTLVILGIALAVLVVDYRNAQTELAALRDERQVELDRQRAMRETILAQDKQVLSLTAETTRLGNDVASMDRLVSEVRRVVGLDRIASAAAPSTTVTATVLVTPTVPPPSTIPGYADPSVPFKPSGSSLGTAAVGTAAVGTAAVGTATPGPATPGPATPGTATPGPATVGTATLGAASAGMAAAPMPATGTTAMGGGSNSASGSDDRAVTNPSSRGGGVAARDAVVQAQQLETTVVERVDALRALRDLVNQRVAKVDGKERDDAASLEKALRLYDAAPKAAPLKGPLNVTSRFGMRVDPVAGWYSSFHYGVDFSAWYGTDVYATKAGKVVYATWQGNLGWTVEIQHELGYKTLYGHNRDLVVQYGQEVQAGQLIAHAGDTGWSTGPHVHYEIELDGKVIDPLTFVDVQGGNGVQPQR